MNFLWEKTEKFIDEIIKSYRLILQRKKHNYFNVVFIENMSVLALRKVFKISSMKWIRNSEKNFQKILQENIINYIIADKFASEEYIFSWRLSSISYSPILGLHLDHKGCHRWP